MIRMSSVAMCMVNKFIILRPLLCIIGPFLILLNDESPYHDHPPYLVSQLHVWNKCLETNLEIKSHHYSTNHVLPLKTC